MAGKKTKTIDGKVYYQQYFAITGQADEPDTWKLPHHGGGQGDVAHDRLSVDWGRVEAACVACESGQFRGNKLDATMTERKTAARHLAAHYRAAKKDVPKGLAAFIAGKKSEGRELPLVDRGQSLEEMVKGSFEYTLGQIRRAFARQFVVADEFYPYLVETFADHVIVRDEGLEVDEYWLVSYRYEDGEYVFAPRADWQKVELTYQPAGELEESGPAPGGERRRFVEQIRGTLTLEEAAETGARYISGVGLTADVINGNGRLYPSAVVKRAVAEAQEHLHESLGQGRIGVKPVTLTGEADHPSAKGHGRPQFLETVVRWTAVEFDESQRQVKIRGRVLDTSKGRDAVAIMEGGVMPDVSFRGWGRSRLARGDDRDYEEVSELVITGFDLLAPGEQSDPGAGIELLENKTRTSGRRGKKMEFEELLEALQEQGILDNLTQRVLERFEEARRQKDEEQRMRMLREALQAKEGEDLIEAARRLAEQQQPGESELEQSLREELGLSDTDDLQEALQQREVRLRALEEAERARQVAAYVEREVGALKYPAWMREQFAEAVQKAEPTTIEEAKAIIVSRRPEYEAILAKMDLVSRGHPAGIEVLGPVLERERGVPAYARAAFEISEALVHRGMWRERDLQQPRTINERFALQYLEKFDRTYRHRLLADARLLEEAEETGDLYLPTSVARAVIAEAFPRLIATSVFDVAMTDQASTRVYYEAYEGETGSTGTVTDEDVVSDEDAWVDMDYQHVQPGTVVVEPNGGGTAFVEGDDYVIDYLNGRFFTISAANGGTIGDGTTVDVDYEYYAYRLGEMEAIERGKGTLSYTTLEMKADRLATEISTEAIKFSKSQVGWDARARTLDMLVRQIQRRIDEGLIYLAVAAALKVASNSGGTWASATDPVSELVEKIGAARVLVGNRYYEPTSILLSLTNSDRVANWDGFAAAGKRPDADVNANGFVGRLKGLPCFESTEAPDSYIVVCNREVVHHRVFSPMELKGPYPSYSSNKLVASEQYYAEEFNGSDAPVPAKASYVKVT